jgi:hypothetical protein
LRPAEPSGPSGASGKSVSVSIITM